MNGRFAVIFSVGVVSEGFTFWQISFGQPYLFKTKEEAQKVFRDQCTADGFAAPPGKLLRFWVIELNDENAFVLGKESTFKLI